MEKACGNFVFFVDKLRNGVERSSAMLICVDRVSVQDAARESRRREILPAVRTKDVTSEK